ncbi:hypothetical protein [Leuconostoc miyukkimchii]|uniref:hypothetical protein n=1 Tax=Leuconostoc miyukkimchii TaxID=910540 RepID=UPI001C7D5568|nr:hypothetical protein [Leuconostoc miyukkimchii]
MADNDYKRPKFQKKTHRIRNFFLVIASLIIIGLGVFIFIGYSSSQKTTEPISEKASNSNTVNETIDSNSSETSNDSIESSSDSQVTSSSDTHSSSTTSSSKSSSSSKNADSNQDSAHLKGKTITEAINWAKAHGRYYSWSITSGGDDAIVTSVTDDGHNISFVASAK